MHLFKLTPIDTETHDWKASAYCGPALVRAETESDARHLTTLRWGQMVRREFIGQPTSVNPWRQKGVVACELVGSDQGEAAVLEPLPVTTEKRLKPWS